MNPLLKTAEGFVKLMGLVGFIYVFGGFLIVPPSVFLGV